MKNRDDRILKATPETNSRYESTEFNLFDTDATDEKALCGADTSADYRRGVRRLPEEPVVWTLGRNDLRRMQGPGHPVRLEYHP